MSSDPFHHSGYYVIYDLDAGEALLVLKSKAPDPKRVYDFDAYKAHSRKVIQAVRDSGFKATNMTWKEITQAEAETHVEMAGMPYVEI